MQFEQLIRAIMKYRQANETRKRRGEKCRKETLPNDCLNILLTFVVMGDGDGGGPTLYLSYYFHFQFYHNYLQNSVIIVSQLTLSPVINVPFSSPLNFFFCVKSFVSLLISSNKSTTSRPGSSREGELRTTSTTNTYTPLSKFSNPTNKKVSPLGT